MKHHIPNGLTVLRLLLAMAFPFVGETWRIPIFVVSALTEWSDGFLSRRWGVVTYWGKILDPIADKAFVFSVIATLFFEGHVELWELAVVGVRDLVVLSGALWIWALGDRSDFERAHPRWLGKITTNFQFAFLFVALWWGEVPVWLTLATAALSLAAAVDYVRFYLRDVRK
jgi:CDP-diacylglycerol--glycerol-3-phosphate 3-phosphatidyltransferase